MLINHSIQALIYGHTFEFDFTAEVTFDLDREHSEDGWYVDEDATISTRGWSGDQMTHITFDDTVKPLVLAAIRKDIDEIMDSDLVRYRHRDEIAQARDKGFKEFEVGR